MNQFCHFLGFAWPGYIIVFSVNLKFWVLFEFLWERHLLCLRAQLLLWGSHSVCNCVILPLNWKLEIICQFLQIVFSFFSAIQFWHIHFYVDKYNLDNYFEADFWYANVSYSHLMIIYFWTFQIPSISTQPMVQCAILPLNWKLEIYFSILTNTFLILTKPWSSLLVCNCVILPLN